MKEFTDAFQRKFKKEPDIYAVVAYDAARVITEGMQRAKSTDSVKPGMPWKQSRIFPPSMAGLTRLARRTIGGSGRRLA